MRFALEVQFYFNPLPHSLLTTKHLKSNLLVRSEKYDLLNNNFRHFSFLFLFLVVA